METRNYLVYLNTEDILPHPKNPRKELGDLTEMAESIKANGVMQNLTVVEVGNLPAERIAELGVTAEDIDEARFMVVIGHRRLAAAKKAGLKEVPCVISNMSYEDQLATMVTENLQRTDLTPIEQAQGLRQLSMELGLGAAQIAEKTGISESTVRRRLKVAAIDQAALENAAKGKQITIGDLEKLGEINSEKLRSEALTYLGTSNFEWKVKNAKEIEKKEAQVAAWTEIMEEMGIRKLVQSERYSSEWTSVVSVSLSSKPSNDKFLGAKLDGTVKPEWEVAYWFNEYPNEVRLYAKTLIKDEKTIAREAWDEEWDARKRTVDALGIAFEELSEKRKFWIGNLDSNRCCGIFGSFMQGAVYFWASIACMPHLTDGQLMEFLGDWDGADGGIDESLMDNVRRDAYQHPVQTAMWAIYAGIENRCYSDMPYKTWQYTGDKTAEQFMGNYEKSERLTLLYDLLEAIGYEVEPYERALLDGTSPMYYANGGKSLEEAKAGTATDPVTTPDDTTEMSRFEALKALPREQLAKYLAAFDKGRAPDGMAEMLDLIGECDSVEALVHKISDWFCCDIPCPVDENGADVRCEICIDMWLRQKKKWGFKTLMKEMEDS